ncbi:MULTISPECIES: hypothetical protein [Vibrio]|uniref:Uncharacterized protein n=1 Tax=Vibrio chanodichtyis TaxID=3027932 RepID=A0ABT5UX52_9VIBR|nr:MULTISPECIES: hypothetical protein [Vibrio]MDE1514013.1 hypothetical protein [Vibrio chanodichtyis]
MNDTDLAAAPWLRLNKAEWTLKLSTSHSANFELQWNGETRYVGEMAVMNNGQPIAMHCANWRFRHKLDRLEQWCQIDHAETLSININYHFVNDALVIEYLARNAVPTRLDIRHTIQPLPQSSDAAPAACSLSASAWQHHRNGLPSEFLAKTQKTDLFREAFSAKQWIILDKL